MPKPKKYLSNCEIEHKYGIRFVVSKEAWPEEYKTLLASIHKISTLTYEGWINKESSSEKTWRKERRESAQRLALDAGKLAEVAARKYEAAWRSLEMDMFRAFKYNSFCGQCNRRMWEAAIPVPPETLLIDNQLRSRQMQRKDCSCPDRKLIGSLMEHQQEQLIPFEPIIVRDIKPDASKPDSVVYLQRCGSIKKYMTAALENTKHYAANTPLWPKTYEKWVFPFLFCEAKSAKAKVSHHDAQFQASLSVREALLAQKNLALNPHGTDGDPLAFTPLVWCITNLGSRCTLLAGILYYQQGWDNNFGYGMDMVTMWDGNIAQEDGALQFLLLVDYIAEWARDVYRENIIERLRIHSELSISRIRDLSPTRSVLTVRSLRPEPQAELQLQLDSITKRVKPASNKLSFPLITITSDNPNSFHSIRSWRRGVKEDTLGQQQECGEVHLVRDLSDASEKASVARSDDDSDDALDEEFVSETTDGLRRYDVSQYAYRNAHIFKRRVLGLYLTTDNLEDYGQAILDSESIEDRFRRIAISFGRHDPLYMNAETLLALENNWLKGESREKQPIWNNPKENLYVLIAFSSYMSPDWEPTQELCYIAMATNVLDEVFKYAAKEVPIFRTTFGLGDVEPFISSISSASIHENIAACIDRSSIVPIFATRYGLIQRQGTADQNQIMENQFIVEKLLWGFSKEKLFRHLVWAQFRIDRFGNYEIDVRYLAHYSATINYGKLLNRARVEPQQLKASKDKLGSTSPWIRHDGHGNPVICELGRNSDLVLCYDRRKRCGAAQEKPKWCLFFFGGQMGSPYPINPEKYAEKGCILAFKTKRLGTNRLWSIKTWNTRLPLSKETEMVVDQTWEDCYQSFNKSVQPKKPAEDKSLLLEQKFSNLNLEAPQRITRSRSSSMGSTTFYELTDDMSSGIYRHQRFYNDGDNGDEENDDEEEDEDEEDEINYSHDSDYKEEEGSSGQDSDEEFRFEKESIASEAGSLSFSDDSS